MDINNVIIQWFYVGEANGQDWVMFPLSFSSQFSYGMGLVIHNHSTEGYVPTIHIYQKQSTQCQVSVRANGGTLGMSFYGVAIGY